MFVFGVILKSSIWVGVNIGKYITALNEDEPWMTGFNEIVMTHPQQIKLGHLSRVSHEEMTGP